MGQDDALPAEHERRRDEIPLQTIGKSQTQLETEVVRPTRRLFHLDKLHCFLFHEMIRVSADARESSVNFLSYIHDFCFEFLPPNFYVSIKESDEDLPGHVESSMQDPLLLHGSF